MARGLGGQQHIPRSALGRRRTCKSWGGWDNGARDARCNARACTSPRSRFPASVPTPRYRRQRCSLDLDPDVRVDIASSFAKPTLFVLIAVVLLLGPVVFASAGAAGLESGLMRLGNVGVELQTAVFDGRPQPPDIHCQDDGCSNSASVLVDTRPRTEQQRSPVPCGLVRDEAADKRVVGKKDEIERLYRPPNRRPAPYLATSRIRI